MKLKFWEKDKPEQFITASIKLATAERMRQNAMQGKLGQEEDEKGQAYSQQVPIVVGLVSAMIIALAGMDGGAINLSTIRLTGISELDNLIFGRGIITFIGSADIDQIITIMVRGILLGLVAGIAPALGMLIHRKSMGRINPFVSCWLVFVSMPVIYLLFSLLLFPLLGL